MYLDSVSHSVELKSCENGLTIVDGLLSEQEQQHHLFKLYFVLFGAARKRPWLSQNLTNQEVNSSSTLMLACLAGGVPLPYIMWYKYGVPVMEGPGNLMDEELEENEYMLLLGGLYNQQEESL